MSTYYWLRMSGCNLSDDKMNTIPCPRFELFTHVETKTIQSGAILGSLAAPIACLVQGKTERGQILDTTYKYGVTGLQIGAVLGPVVYMAFTLGSKPDRDSVKDRCYRVRYSRNQMFVDRISFLGLAAGMGVAKYLGEELGRGAFFGFTGGCFLAGVTNILSGMM